MDILISDNPYDLLWKKRGSKYLTTDEVQNLHNALIEDSKKHKPQIEKPIYPEVNEPEVNKEYLHIVPLTDNGVTIIYEISQCNKDYVLEYKIGDSEWNKMELANSPDLSIYSCKPIVSNDIVYLRGYNSTKNNVCNIGRFIKLSGKFKLAGNIMSLLFKDDFIDKFDLSEYPYIFHHLFASTDIAELSKGVLPATKLGNMCYMEMFANCMQLRNLYLDIHNYQAYYRMFYTSGLIDNITLNISNDVTYDTFSTLYMFHNTLISTGTLYINTIEYSDAEILNGLGISSSWKVIRTPNGKQTKLKYMLFGAPAAEDTTPDITEEDVNKDQTTFTGLPFLIGTEEEESVGSSIPYICSEDLVFIIASESGNGYL